MKRIFITIALILLPISVFAADRILFEGFEDQSYLDTFTSSDSGYCTEMLAAWSISSSSPAIGSYCALYDAESYTNGRVNIGEVAPYSGACGTANELTNYYTNYFAVRFKIKYASDFYWGSNCKKILRIKGSTYGADAYLTLSQYGTNINIFLGQEAYSYDGLDLRYESYNPPENEWITVYVLLSYQEDEVYISMTDSGGEHVLYDGTYFDTGGAGYDAFDMYYITICGARCGTAAGGTGDIYVDDIEIWNGEPDSGEPDSGDTLPAVLSGGPKARFNGGAKIVMK